jgi:hypothetical protein
VGWGKGAWAKGGGRKTKAKKRMTDELVAVLKVVAISTSSLFA